MTTKKMPIRPIVGKPSPEEQEAQAKRAFLQKRASLVEIILSNSLQGSAFNQTTDPRMDFRPAVDAAIEAADYLMEKLYGVAIETKTEE